jgi:hypothetical protein
MCGGIIRLDENHGTSRSVSLSNSAGWKQFTIAIKNGRGKRKHVQKFFSLVQQCKKINNSCIMFTSDGKILITCT